MKIIETERLYLRELNENDYKDLCEILQDKNVMYSWEHVFSDEEIKDWLNKQRERYKEYGFGFWAVIEKISQELVGQCGLMLQDDIGREYIEISYMLKQKFWHNGFATEAANACKNYAFNVLNVSEVYSTIRVNNISSQKVAERIGMKIDNVFLKYYKNIEMPHYLYSIKRDNCVE